MNQKQRKALEGSIVAISLTDGAWGVGVVCRTSKSGILLVRFYGGRFKSPEDVSSNVDATFRPDEAVAVARVGDLGIRDGRWTVIKKLPDWTRSEWGQLCFSRVEKRNIVRYYLEEYDDDDPNSRIGSERVSLEVAEHFPSEDLLGSGAAAAMLDRITLGTSTTYEMSFPSFITSTLRRDSTG